MTNNGTPSHNYGILSVKPPRGLIFSGTFKGGLLEGGGGLFERGAYLIFGKNIYSSSTKQCV